jgi:hypothetical protein
VIIIPKHLDPTSLERILVSFQPIHQEECNVTGISGKAFLCVVDTQTMRGEKP